MSRNNSLFVLIKSLSQSEKSYFKKFIVGSRDSSGKNYFKLFCEIDRQEEYDEKKIVFKFKNEIFIKRFPVAKAYLFQVILKSLKQQYSGEGSINILFNLLTESDILFSKTLYSEAEFRLIKALDIAEKKEKFSTLLEICDRYFKLMQIKYSVSYSKTNWFYALQLKTIEDLRQIAEIRNLLHTFIQIRDSGKPDKTKEMGLLKQHPYFVEPENLKSFRAKVAIYNLKSLINRFEKAEKNITLLTEKKLIDLFESNPEMAQEEQLSHIAILSNYITNIIVLGKKDEFKKYISVLENLKVSNQEKKLRIFEKVILLKLNYYLVSKKITEGVAYCNEIKGELGKNAEKFFPNFYIAIYDTMSTLYYFTKDYSSAIRCINKVILRKDNVTPEVKCFSHILYLIIQYEKHDFDHLEYFLKTTERFIKRSSVSADYALVLISFLKNAILATEKSELKQLLTKLRVDISKCRNNNIELFDFFDFEEWAKNKLTNY